MDGRSRLLREKVSGFSFEVNVDRPVLVRCASCGRNFETERYGKQTCPICGAEIILEDPKGETPPDPDPDPVPVPVPDPDPDPDPDPSPQPKITATVPEVPHAKLEIVPAWEVPGAGLLRRFFATLRQVLSAPSLLFYGLKINNFSRALSFGWILCTLAVFFSMIYSLWSLDRDPQAILRNLQIPAGTNPQELIDALHGQLLVGLYTSPLLGLLNLFASALLYHLGVWLLSKKNRGFLATFRASAYACAPLLFAVVPSIGLLLGGLGTIALQILALSAVHRLSPLRASVAVILPTVAVLLLIMAFF
jgi:predicted RNA-binding Zn-ribbon protein involved in translation (DUF1610 family)